MTRTGGCTAFHWDLCWIPVGIWYRDLGAIRVRMRIQDPYHWIAGSLRFVLLYRWSRCALYRLSFEVTWHKSARYSTVATSGRDAGASSLYGFIRVNEQHRQHSKKTIKRKQATGINTDVHYWTHAAAHMQTYWQWNTISIVNAVALWHTTPMTGVLTKIFYSPQ